MKTIKIPKIASRQGIGFIGIIGSGKTQGMMQLFDSYINSKKVIVDVKGDYTSIYQKAEDKFFVHLIKEQSNGIFLIILKLMKILQMLLYLLYQKTQKYKIHTLITLQELYYQVF